MRALAMPKLGLTMTEARIAEWRVQSGGTFRAGDTLLVVETDKIATDIDAQADGRLDRILRQAGETAMVGEPIAEWTPASPPSGGVRRIVATPLARRRARELGVDLAPLRGSGPGGRIKAADVAAAAPSVTTPPAATPPAVPPARGRDRATAMERATAERLSRAAGEVPQFALATEVDAGALRRLRDDLAAAPGGRRFTLTPFLLAALAGAFRDEPTLNRVWEADGPRLLAGVDLGLAVHTDKGLYAPVLRDVGGLTIHALANRIAEAAAACRAGRLAAGTLDGGVATLSNAGMHDVTYMTSIVPPGQAAILGVGATRAVFRPDAEGRPVLRHEIGLVLSADHRVLDGVTGLRLLAAIRRRLEAPLSLLFPG